jgi:hypothetical protein
VPFSYIAHPDSFSTVPRSCPVFMFGPPRLIFDGTEGVGSLFHVLRSRTPFRWYRGIQIPFSCFAIPNSFSAVSRASGLIFMLSARTNFWRYRGRWVQFSCFALAYSFSAVPGASGLIFMFCAPGIVFNGTEGAGSRFHVLCFRTRFRRC